MPNESAAPPPEPKQDEKAPDSKSAAPEAKGRPTSERRFVQRQIVQPLIQWMPLGGSGWLFGGFLLKQEWMQVLLTFPVMVVTAVWAAYSKNFIEQLSEIYADRAKKDASALVAWLDALNEALKCQLAGFETQYLKRQAQDCQQDIPVGLDRGERSMLFRPELEKVFVPLNLTPVYRVTGDRPERWLRDSGDRAPGKGEIWDLLKRVDRGAANRHLALRALGGSGKTTLLKHVAYVYGKGTYRQKGAPKLIPFLLFLKDCRRELTKENPPNLPDLLTHYHLPGLPGGKALNPPPSWAANLLNQGTALVMFDGFDEVPAGDRPLVSQWLSDQMRQYPDAVFIITSRPRAYTEDFRDKPETYVVEEFEPHQQQLFIHQWYLSRACQGDHPTRDQRLFAERDADRLWAEIAARPEDLGRLPRNPLMLNMICRFHSIKQSAELPSRRSQLYREICEIQLGWRPQARNIELLLDSIDQRREVLQRVALEMMLRATADARESAHKQIEKDDLLGIMQAAFTERNFDVNAADFLAQMVDVSELLVKHDEVYEFAHLGFQEFLTASELVRRRDESLITDRLGLETWKPTLLLYAELLKHPLSFMELTAQQAPQLFAESLPLIDRQRLSAAELAALERLKPAATHARYAKLEALMRLGDWAGADDETYRLMITTVGKEEGDWFTSEELLNFPCEELLAIDRLWVKHSQGQFGFSVQKEIYVACGAKLDGQYPGDKIWEDFGTRVGWLENDDWKSRDELKMNPRLSPKGEFPFVFGDFAWVYAVAVSSLASRLVNCSRPQS
ncbi:MAG: GUN4 domain-containing protein [Limnothrix sp.]|nr:GUN4 domain-containing protein [Limnothrix sp.]